MNQFKNYLFLDSICLDTLEYGESLLRKTTKNSSFILGLRKTGNKCIIASRISHSFNKHLLTSIASCNEMSFETRNYLADFLREKKRFS